MRGSEPQNLARDNNIIIHNAKCTKWKSEKGGGARYFDFFHQPFFSNETKPMNTAYLEGKDGYLNGLELHDNPYLEAESDLAQLWESGWNDALEARQQFRNKTPPKTLSFLMKLKRGWGMIFRSLFIVLIGFIGYFWIDPHSIGDIPFSELTLNHIFANLFAGLLVVGCIAWFFNFPEQHEEMEDEDNPYIMWANFSGGLIVIGILIWFWLNK